MVHASFAVPSEVAIKATMSKQ